MQHVLPTLDWLDAETENWNTDEEKKRASEVSADVRQAYDVLHEATEAMLFYFRDKIRIRRSIDFVQFAYKVGFVQKNYSDKDLLDMRSYVEKFYKEHPDEVSVVLQRQKNTVKPSLPNGAELSAARGKIPPKIPRNVVARPPLTRWVSHH